MTDPYVPLREYCYYCGEVTSSELSANVTSTAETCKICGNVVDWWDNEEE